VWKRQQTSVSKEINNNALGPQTDLFCLLVQHERGRLITQNVKQYVKRTIEKKCLVKNLYGIQQRSIIIYRHRVGPLAEQEK
jgi:hypothetical protein